MDMEGEPTTTHPTATRPRGPRRRLPIAYTFGLLALIAAAGVGVGSRVALSHTAASLSTTRVDLHRAVARLGATRSQLAEVNSQSDAAARTLASVTSELYADQAELARAQTNIVSKGVSISELDTCLSGVERALNQISVGDQSGAATTLSGASASCRAAQPA